MRDSALVFNLWIVHITCDKAFTYAVVRMFRVVGTHVTAIIFSRDLQDLISSTKI